MAVPVRWSHTCCSVRAPRTSRPVTTDASGRLSSGHQQAGAAGRPGRQRHGERAPDGPQVALESHLADHQRADEPIARELPAGDEDPQGDGQIERRAVLADVGGREVDGDAAERKLEAGVGQSGAHPLSALLDRAVRQADGAERGETAADVHLDVHGIGVDAEDGGGTNAGEHALKVKAVCPGAEPRPRPRVRNPARLMQYKVVDGDLTRVAAPQPRRSAPSPGVQ